MSSRASAPSAPQRGGALRDTTNANSNKTLANQWTPEQLRILQLAKQVGLPLGIGGEGKQFGGEDPDDHGYDAEPQHTEEDNNAGFHEEHTQHDTTDYANGANGVEGDETAEVADGLEGVDLVDVGGAVDADGVGASVHADPFLTAEWSIGAARYEWSDEYGDLGPQIPELEEMLFSGTENAGQVGAHINSLLSLDVKFESVNKLEPCRSFADAGLHPQMLENIKLCGYEIPTPVQAYCMPAIFLNQDIIAISQTGSGKTGAFLIPTISKLMGKAKKLAAPRPFPGPDFDPRVNGVVAEPLIVVLVPTRELALQIFNDARRLCYRSMLRPCVVYGGAPARAQIDELRKGCDILIATLGRLKDFIMRGEIVSMKRVKYTIIDEADELVTESWKEDLELIVSGSDNNMDADRTFMLFSATFPPFARQLAREYLADDHIKIRVGRMGSTHKNIVQKILWCDDSDDEKKKLLYDLFIDMAAQDKIGKIIIFCNHKNTVEKIDDHLFVNNLPSTSIHSGRPQLAREDALRSFKSGKTPFLVTTSVFARGMDIHDVRYIINADLPTTEHGGIAEYVHRIGRTGRMGFDGQAISLFNDGDAAIAEDLVKVLLENEQEVPDFLDQYKPAEGEELTWDDDKSLPSEDEAEERAEGGGWGAGAGEGGAWGAEPAAAAADDDGWNAETPAVADGAAWDAQPAAESAW